MLLSIIVNWLIGLLINKYRNEKIKSKIIIITMLIFNLGIEFIKHGLIYFIFSSINSRTYCKI